MLNQAPENPQDVPMQVDHTGDSDDDWEDEERAGLLTFPPGEEGFLQSHAGGEAVLHDILDGMTNSCAFPSVSPPSFADLPSKRIDSRTRRDRIKQRIDAWKRQTPILATVYLRWKCSGDPAPEIDSQELWTIEVMSFTCSYAFPPTFHIA
jgi:hypothetical protein